MNRKMIIASAFVFMMGLAACGGNDMGTQPIERPATSGMQQPATSGTGVIGSTTVPSMQGTTTAPAATR